ncbi:MAG: AAA family ATPase [Chloroflexota bacterium]|nr:AAA family ATPase [Chloroflexota bacterium]
MPALRLLAAHEAPERHHEADFVGRSRELAAIHEAWQRALSEQSCELVTIAGEAGVGKSRLVEEALHAIEARVVHGRCLPYGEGITYWPVVEVLKQLNAVPSDPAALAAIRSLLSESPGDTSAEEIAWAFRKLLEEEAPLIVVFDDIQWGEETFLNLLEHVALLSSDVPLLLICMARPELVEGRPAWPLTLRLDPLPGDDVGRLIGERVPAELRDRIASAAGGNPLFVAEMLAMAEQDGREVAVPPTLRALLTARLDQLDLPERRVLECGAVEGGTFHRGAVNALVSDEAQVTRRLAALVRKELVRPEKAQLAGEDAFRFRHLLIRDAAYDALPKAKRAELHERLAAWLEQHGPDLVELDEVLGYHLEQAVRYRGELGLFADEHVARRATARLASAGHRALAHGDSRAAVNQLGRAVELAESINRVDVELLLDLAGAHVGAGDLAAGLARASEAAELARSRGERTLELRARCERALIRAITDPRFTAEGQIEEGERAVKALNDVGDDAGLAAAWRLIAAGENLRGNWTRMAAALTQALPHARRAGDRRRERDLVRELALCAYWGPTPVAEALPRCEEMLAQAGGGLLRAILLMCIGGLHGMQGRFDEARGLLGEAESICKELGRRLELAALGFFRGPLELAAGEAAAAEAALRASCDALQKMGETGWLSSLAAYLAESIYTQDRLDEAEEEVRRSREAAAPDDEAAQAGWRAAQARILARRGEFEEAERLARDAIAIADRSDQPNDRGDTRISLAEVQRLAQRPDEAIPTLAEAVALYEQKGNSVSAAKARALLGELGTTRCQIHG